MILKMHFLKKNTDPLPRSLREVVKRSFSRSLRPNFVFHLVFTGFHLEFLSFWVLRSFDFRDLSDLRYRRAEDFNL